MTPEQKQKARHALGLPNDRRRSYRNRFFVSVGSPDDALWKALSDADDADYVTVNRGKDRQYWLTRQGALKALEPGETLDAEDFPAEEAHG